MVFLRRTSHYASIVTLLLVGASSALAQSQDRPRSDSRPSSQAAADATAPPSQPTTVNQIFGPLGDPSPQREEQKSYGKKFVDNALTDPIVLLTVVLSVLTVVQICVYRGEVNDMRVTERAYIDPAHLPPGLIVEELTMDFEGVSKTKIRAAVAIRNHGTTPAQVTGTRFRAFTTDAPLPVDPPYLGEDHAVTMHASLVKDKKFAIPVVDWVPSDELERVYVPMSGWDLYFIGYVDYIDRFGIRHRTGYARIYDPTKEFQPPSQTNDQFLRRNNLGFVTQPGYNYDRKRKKGEGNDWKKQ